jgi:hypothetical protein
MAKTWISIGEAVAKIMQSHNVTARQARRILKKAVKSGKVKPRKAGLLPKQPKLPEPLAPEEAAERFSEKSDRAFMPLGYFIERFGFTQDEINTELRSGRLKVGTDEDTWFSIEMAGGTSLDADYFRVSAKAIHDWLFNPKTPRHLIAKIRKLGEIQ